MEKTREKKKLKNLNSQRAITLIALVVTIVVLLILAGVSLNLVLGENGIINKAKDAKESSEIAEEKDAIGIAYSGAYATNLGDKVTKDDLNEQFTINKTKATARGSIIVEFESGRIYKISANGTILGPYENGEVSEEPTLVDFFLQAEADKCTNEDGTCENPEHLHIGDYVNLENPTSASYTVEDSKVGMDRTDEMPITNQTYTISASEIESENKNQLNWRVLGIDKETGGLKLVSGTALKSDTLWAGKELPYLFMYGAKGYIEGYEELNNICDALYGNYNTNLIEKARSINQDDINELTKRTTEGAIKEVNAAYYEGGKQYKDVYEYDGQYTPETWLAKTEEKDTAGKITGTVEGYYYKVNLQTEDNAPYANLEVPYVKLENSRIYNLLFDNTNMDVLKGMLERHYLLASHGTIVMEEEVNFCLNWTTTINNQAMTGSTRYNI